MNWDGKLYTAVKYKPAILQEAAVEAVDLEPLYEPEPVPFSFDTPAWYVVGGLVVLAFLLGAYRFYANYKRNGYRQQALTKMDALQEHLVDGQYQAGLLQLKVILKQVAIISYGRVKSAALYGEEWLRFLEGTGKNTAFMPYRDLFLNSDTEIQEAEPAKQLKGLLEVSKRWIKTHA